MPSLTGTSLKKFKEVFLWFPFINPVTMASPKILAVSSYTFGKCLYDSPAAVLVQ